MSYPEIALEEGLDLSKVMTTGSILQINEDYTEVETEPEKIIKKDVTCFGEPVKCFDELERTMTNLDENGWVKKKILEEGGGNELDEGCTVSVAYTSYWEDDLEPFDVRSMHKPLVVNIKDNGLLPGMLTAVKSMLVGELSVFILSHHVMYGELGIPPRIKPRASCLFYIKLVKSILTPAEGDINFSESNIFRRVHQKAKQLFVSGSEFYKMSNYLAAVQIFQKAVFMLHRVRLADENEEKEQEKLLLKLYNNLAHSYNRIKQPNKTCIACNEYNRLSNIWNNGKMLYQNAIALRMLGDFKQAEKKLRRAINLCPKNEEMKTELEKLQSTRKLCDQSKLIIESFSGPTLDVVSDTFKSEVDNLIRNFKKDSELWKLTLPSGLNNAEIEYVNEACRREGIFCNKVETDLALDKSEARETVDDLIDFTS